MKYRVQLERPGQPPQVIVVEGNWPRHAVNRVLHQVAPNSRLHAFSQVELGVWRGAFGRKKKALSIATVEEIRA